MRRDASRVLDEFPVSWLCEMWMFMRMEANRLVREIKRLELQIARKG